MAAPATLHTLLWIGVPMLIAISLSFTRYDIISAPTFVGLENYFEIAGNSTFWTAVRNTSLLAALTVPVSMLIAMVLAVMLNQAMRGVTLFRTAIFLPQVTATVAIAMIWLWIFIPNETGLLNRVLAVFGLGSHSWLTATTTALGSVALVMIWQGIGLKMLIYLAALQALPHDVYEAASLDGAGALRKFLSITVPLLKPATFFVLVTSLIGTFQAFDLIYVLTSGGPANATTVVTYQIYQSAFDAFRMGLASAQSVVLLVFLVLLTLLSRRVTRER